MTHQERVDALKRAKKPPYRWSMPKIAADMGDAFTSSALSQAIRRKSEGEATEMLDEWLISHGFAKESAAKIPEDLRDAIARLYDIIADAMKELESPASGEAPSSELLLALLRQMQVACLPRIERNMPHLFS